MDKNCKNLISKDEFDIGTAKTDKKMSIDLIDNQPIISRPYKLDNIRTAQVVVVVVVSPPRHHTPH